MSHCQEENWKGDETGLARVYVSKERIPGPGLNRFKGVITEIIPSEFMIRFRVKVAENVFLVELDPDIFNDMGLKVGSDVFLTLKLKWIRIL